MRIGTLDGRLVLLVGAGAVDVARASDGRLPSDPSLLFDHWDDLRAWAGAAPTAGRVEPYDPALLGPPVPRPRQVFAVALNYPPHAAEAGFVPPDQPLVFTKFPTCITGPHADVVLPAGDVDWELELVVVIAREAFAVPRGRAWDVVAGLTVGQDLSERRLQTAGQPPQFSLAKSHPGFGPIGPALVTPDELADPDDLELTGELNGEVVQHARTKEMVFGVPDLIAHVSAVCPLLPGDLLFTGTPAGVGNRRRPPRFLRPGDVLTSSIDGLGRMSHRFVAPVP